jgi:hypothetical protein
MSFLKAVVDAVKPQPSKPTLGPADLQGVKLLQAREAHKQKQADDTRRRELEHRLADEDRKNLHERRDTVIAAAKESGKPLSPSELRVLDAEVELMLAEKAFYRDPGQPRVLGDGTLEMSRQKGRVKSAERALKAALDAQDRTAQLTASLSAQPQIYCALPSARGYFDHREHMENVLASRGVK